MCNNLNVTSTHLRLLSAHVIKPLEELKDLLAQWRGEGSPDSNTRRQLRRRVQCTPMPPSAGSSRRGPAPPPEVTHRHCSPGLWGEQQACTLTAWPPCHEPRLAHLTVCSGGTAHHQPQPDSGGRRQPGRVYHVALTMRTPPALHRSQKTHS